MAMRSSMWAWASGVCAVFLAGCAGLPDWTLFSGLQEKTGVSAPGSYSFAWRLSGDRRAGPLQVFDDGQKTWLQFVAGQAVPAIFAHTPQGDQLLGYHRQGHYVVLPGVWPVLLLRAGGMESRAERIEPVSSSQVSHNETHRTLSRQSESLPVDDPEVRTVAAPPEPSGLALGEDTSSTKVAADINGAPPETTRLESGRPIDGANSAGLWESSVVRNGAAEKIARSSVTPDRATAYRVSPQDGNIRLALSRWAALSGWTFEPEHWAVDVDIPIVGSAAFELEFDEAVQQLLASTELSERPLQPCFYANKVLRIVPFAQSCDRTMIREHA